MNILLLHSASDTYGSSRIFLEVVKIYLKAGINPVVLLSGEGPLTEKLQEMNVRIEIQNLGILRRKYVTPIGLLNRFSKNRKAYAYLDSLHAKYDFKLIYSNTLAVIIGAFWAQRNQLPHIWHIHEILPGPAALVKLLAKMLDSSTPNPIVVSNAVATHWNDRLKTSKPVVIHNGICYDSYLKEYPNAKSKLGLPVDNLVITMIGRINPGKGQLFFLEVAKRLIKSYPHLHFVLTGDPFPGYEPIAEGITEFIVKNNLEQNVTDLGFRSDIPMILAATDIFMLPSILSDSFPTVILEAMASGKPVIATQSGGAEEMLTEGKNGFLIPIGNVDKAVSAFKKLIEQEELRLAFGNSGRTKVLQEYSLELFEEKITKHLWQQLERN